ncbi:MAG: GntR family transcriptional regulator [Kouleothrix sp.]|jgi:DNA-binding GntR family transcriptional regulator|nr:GntR family transcriptional regulator [Kouleothrix sp.]
MQSEPSPFAGFADQLKLDRRAVRLRELAYQAIKQAILSGAIDSSAPLIEERLGLMLQISRTPVREALAILEHEGLIEALPYKGIFVKVVTVESFLKMYEALETVEAALARQAALRADAADLAAMEHSLGRAERCVPHDIPGHLAACRMFQRQLGACAHNPYLADFLVGIEERADLYLISTWHTLPADKMRAAIHDRRVILAAVQARDPEAAAQAAEAHAQAARQRWRALFSSAL